MARVYPAFVGCKVSQADCEAAALILERAGHEVVGDRDQADLCVVMSCCVTSEAERKSRQLARRLRGEGRRVVVAGCAATLRPAQFAEKGIETLRGRDWLEVAGAGSGRSGGPGDAAFAAAAGVAGRGAGADGSEAVIGVSRARAARRGARTRLTLKVQDGCAASCSYCAVRLARGKLWSLPLADALAAAREGVAAGCGEVVLSGIDLGSYSDGEDDLAALVGALAGVPGLARLRLSSLEPQHLDERLLTALERPRIARHLHVPLQSADDGVLGAMQRPYTFAAYCEKLESIRQRLGGVMISTDVIIGFPGEDETAFARTLTAIDAPAGLFGRVHVFGYSPRPDTVAQSMPRLPSALVKERMRAALAAAQRSADQLRRGVLGRPAEVLLEECRDDAWRGYSSDYVRYYLEAPGGHDGTGAFHAGQLVPATAQELFRDGVKGTRI